MDGYQKYYAPFDNGGQKFLSSGVDLQYCKYCIEGIGLLKISKMKDGQRRVQQLHVILDDGPTCAVFSRGFQTALLFSHFEEKLMV